MEKIYDEKQIIKNVASSDVFHFISMHGGGGFGLDKKWGVIPITGDVIEIALVQGSTVRGVKLNGREVFYKTDEQLEVERQQWLKEYKEKQLREFEKNKSQMDADYESLPDFFKKRIDGFREKEPNFRIESEGYEVFCCMEAVKIANACKTPEKVQEFKHAEWDVQRRTVVDLSDDHTGNTFYGSCHLAYLLLRNS